MSNTPTTKPTHRPPYFILIIMLAALAAIVILEIYAAQADNPALDRQIFIIGTSILIGFLAFAIITNIISGLIWLSPQHHQDRMEQAVEEYQKIQPEIAHWNRYAAAIYRKIYYPEDPDSDEWHRHNASCFYVICKEPDGQTTLSMPMYEENANSEYTCLHPVLTDTPQFSTRLHKHTAKFDVLLPKSLVTTDPEVIAKLSQSG